MIYPKINKVLSKVYIRVPVRKRGSWFSADVLEDGKTKSISIFETSTSKRSCQLKCDSHNLHYGWSKSNAKQILRKVGYKEK